MKVANASNTPQQTLKKLLNEFPGLREACLDAAVERSDEIIRRHVEAAIAKFERQKQHADSADDLIEDAELNPAVPLIENFLYVGDRVMLHGYEETMKSLGCAAICDSLATGKPFLGELRVPKAVNVGIVETEMRNPGLGTRLKKMYPNQSPVDMFFLSRDKLKQFKRSHDEEARLKIIKDWVVACDIEVVVFDVISDLFCKRSANDENDVMWVFDQLELMTEVKAWILVRHDAKPTPQNATGNANNKIRGSSEWKENPDSIFEFKKNPKSRNKLVTVEVGKLRYGQKPEPFDIRYDLVAGVVVPRNPVMSLLGEMGTLSRDEILVECGKRYVMGQRQVDDWLSERMNELDVVQQGHKKMFSRKPGLFPDLIWKL